MSLTRIPRLLFLPAIFILIALACTLPSNQPAPPPVVIPVEVTATPVLSAATLPNTPVIVHIVSPSTSSSYGALVYDVESSGTAPEKRAPYGDSYKLNRLERPFQQDMTYIPDLDIVTYNLSKDDTWIYVSIDLIGTDPNNPVGINYGVEIDNDIDGFGDTIVWAHPPYTPEWSADNVQVFVDKNHDTGGLSATRSDAPLDGDGYETMIFDGGVGNDPDLAWVRINAGAQATVQFAFKRSLTDGTYMLGVLADTGLKDVGMLDYVDRFTEAEAGSPEKNEPYYPLKALYSVDNTCWEAFGFNPSGNESKICPREEQPTKEPGQPPPTLCPRPLYCVAPSYLWHQDTCTCEFLGPF